VAEGFGVAMNWANSQKAKGLGCLVIALAMMGGRGVLIKRSVIRKT
jgi:hypothetical protein